MKTIVAAATLAIAATLLPGDWLELRPDPSLLRILTCHFTHWSFEQLAWDALAFTALGIACARRNARATHATLLASVLLIPVAVLAFAPDVIAYRGLSGLASAMFALLLMLERRRLTWPVVAFAILFGAKLAFEAITGGAVFANDMGVDVVAVPVAHLAGALVGVIGGIKRTAFVRVERWRSKSTSYVPPGLQIFGRLQRLFDVRTASTCAGVWPGFAVPFAIRNPSRCTRRAGIRRRSRSPPPSPSRRRGTA